MANEGALSSQERVELVRGVVRQIGPKSRAHVIAATTVFTLLSSRLRGRASVFKGDPLVLEPMGSELAPDIVVCSNPDIQAYGTPEAHPLLVVEVADSSLRYDLGEKAELYAGADLREYWVLNLWNERLEVFRTPRSGHYRVHQRLERGARVCPKAWPDLELDVASMLPRKD